MGLSIRFLEQGVEFIATDAENEEVSVGRIPPDGLSPNGLVALKEKNYLMQGTVGYQSFLEGVLAGVVLIFGPPKPTQIPVDAPAEAETEVPVEVKTGETAASGLIDAAVVSAPAVVEPEVIVPVAAPAEPAAPAAAAPAELPAPPVAESTAS